jgi:LDH2 family malate/lactate/ureidoglycolate dehydrogenase
LTSVDAEGDELSSFGSAAGMTNLSAEAARMLAVGALKSLSFSDDETSVIADQLIDNSMSGYEFAGLSRILDIAGEPGLKTPRRPPAIVRESSSFAVVDGGNTIGYVTAARAAEIAVDKAKSSGVGIVGVHNSWSSGRNAYFVEKIVKFDLVAIHSASARARVAPPGAAAAALGANPISFGFPSNHGPVIVDFGTASLMWGEILRMTRASELLAEGVAIDAAGLPTRDPAKAAAVAPFGGHKGYALGFAIQALGLLAGAALQDGASRDYGFLFVAIDPDQLLPAARFKAEMSALVARIKATPRLPGVDEIRIPSERAFREREQRRKTGIPMNRKLIDALKRMADAASPPQEG